MTEDVTMYLPEMDTLRHQGLLYFAQTIKDTTDSTYKDLQTVKLDIRLPTNQHVNLNSYKLCFPIKIKKKTTTATNTDANMVTFNNLFAHWLKVIEVNTHEMIYKLFLVLQLMSIYIQITFSNSCQK